MRIFSLKIEVRQRIVESLFMHMKRCYETIFCRMYICMHKNRHSTKLCRIDPFSLNSTNMLGLSTLSHSTALENNTFRYITLALEQSSLLKSKRKWALDHKAVQKLPNLLYLPLFSGVISLQVSSWRLLYKTKFI